MMIKKKKRGNPLSPQKKKKVPSSGPPPPFTRCEANYSPLFSARISPRIDVKNESFSCQAPISRPQTRINSLVWHEQIFGPFVFYGLIGASHYSGPINVQLSFLVGNSFCVFTFFSPHCKVFETRLVVETVKLPHGKVGKCSGSLFTATQAFYDSGNKWLRWALFSRQPWEYVNSHNENAEECPRPVVEREYSARCRKKKYCLNNQQLHLMKCGQNYK